MEEKENVETEEKETVETKEEKCTCDNCAKKGKGFLTTLIIIVLMAAVGVCGWIVGVSKAASLVETSRETNNGTTKTEEKRNIIRPIDLTKDINNTGNEYERPNDLTKTLDYLGLYVEKIDDKSVKINYENPEKFCEFYTIKDCSNIKSRKADTVKFDKNVLDVFIGGIGQDNSGTIIFYLMEDGTMQYYRLSKKDTLDFNDLDNKVEGTLDGVKDVMHLYSVGVIKRPIGSYGTTLGSKADGSFYDLGQLVSDQK